MNEVERDHLLYMSNKGFEKIIVVETHIIFANMIEKKAICYKKGFLTNYIFQDRHSGEYNIKDMLS
jgi:hypothetical protein